MPNIAENYDLHKENIWTDRQKINFYKTEV